MAERGLLGRIGSGIQGLLGNPSVRGVGAAAAFGVNPLLGLLAAPAIRGNQTSRDRAALENQAARENLAERRSQREALNRLSGLLQSSSVIQGQGGVMPPESVSGPAEELQIPGRRAQVQTINTPQGRRELQGVLAQAAPEGVAGLLAKQAFGQPEGPRLPTDVQAFLAAGGSLDDPQVQQALRDRVLNTEDPQAQLELNKLMLEVQNALDQRRQAQEDRAQSEQSRKRSIQSTLKKGQKLVELNDRLAKGPLRPGGTALDLRRSAVDIAGDVGGLLGQEEFSRRQRDTVDTFDEFNKTANDFVIEMMSAMEGRVTDQKLRALQSASAGIGTSPGANRAIVAQTIETALEEADQGNFEIENRAQFETLLEQLRSQDDPVRAQASQLDGFNDLSPSEQEELVELLRANSGQ